MRLELKKIKGIRDIEKAYSIYHNNPYYFAKTTEESPTLQSVKEDMEAIPLGVSNHQKEYALLKCEGDFIGIIDLIKFYPTDDTHYIGLFMLDKNVQGNHLGSKVIKELIKVFKEEGIKKIRLAVVLDNQKAYSFWQNLGFMVIEEKKAKLSEKIEKEVAVMEKAI